MPRTTDHGRVDDLHPGRGDLRQDDRIREPENLAESTRGVPLGRLCSALHVFGKIHQETPELAGTL